MVFFPPFTFPPFLFLVIWDLFLLLVLVHNETLPDSTRLFLVVFRFFRTVRRRDVIGFVFLCIHEHIIISLSLTRLNLRRRGGHDRVLEIDGGQKNSGQAKG
jgi:hypothetical protein